MDTSSPLGGVSHSLDGWESPRELNTTLNSASSPGTALTPLLALAFRALAIPNYFAGT